MNLFDLTGKNALIVGGAGGLGKLVAKAFAEAGANVAIASRTESKLQAACDELKAQTGKEFKYYIMDAGVEEQVAAAAEKANADYGHIDILVNSQGVNKKFSALEHPVAEWDEMFAANVRSIMLTCKYFGQGMKDQHWGRIINVSSIGAVRSKMSDISVCYGSTKGAVNAYSLNLAAGWAQYGITVNCIAPIMTETEMMKPIFEKNPELLTGTIARVPAGRVGKVEDCAGLAMFFASEAAGFVTGQILYPDGGLCTLQ